MSKERRQQVLLGVLALVLVVVVGRTFIKIGGSSGGPSSRSGGFRPRSAPGATADGELQIVDLHLEELGQKPGEFTPGRDPFRFKPKPQPKAAPPKPKPQQRRPPPRQQPRPAARPAGPRPPALDFVFLGTFGPEGRSIAVFSDQQEIYNVMEGEIFKEKFVLRKIGEESADIGFVEFPEEPIQRLAFGG